MKFKVTKKHIEEFSTWKAKVVNGYIKSNCPVALAIKEKYPDIDISVGTFGIRFYRKKDKSFQIYDFHNNDDLYGFILKMDSPLKCQKLEDFEFEIPDKYFSEVSQIE